MFSRGGADVLVARSSACSGDGYYYPTGRVVLERIDAATGDTVAVLHDYLGDFHQVDALTTVDSSGRFWLCDYARSGLGLNTDCAPMSITTLSHLPTPISMAGVTLLAAAPGGGVVVYNQGPWNTPAIFKLFDANGVQTGGFSLADENGGNMGNPYLDTPPCFLESGMMVISSYDSRQDDTRHGATIRILNPSTGIASINITYVHRVLAIALSCPADGSNSFWVYQFELDTPAKRIIHYDSSLSVISQFSIPSTTGGNRMLVSATDVFVANGNTVWNRYSYSGSLVSSISTPYFLGATLSSPTTLLLGTLPRSSSAPARLVEVNAYTGDVLRSGFNRPLMRCPLGVTEDDAGVVWVVSSDSDVYGRQLHRFVGGVWTTFDLPAPLELTMSSFPFPWSPVSVIVLGDRIAVSFYSFIFSSQDGFVHLFDRNDPTLHLGLMPAPAGTVTSYTHCFPSCPPGNSSHFYCVATTRSSTRILHRLDSGTLLPIKVYSSELSDGSARKLWRASCDARGNLAQIFFSSFFSDQGVRFWDSTSGLSVGGLGSRTGSSPPRLENPVDVGAVRASGTILLLDRPADSSFGGSMIACTQPPVSASVYPRQVVCETKISNIGVSIPDNTATSIHQGPGSTLFLFLDDDPFTRTILVRIYDSQTGSPLRTVSIPPFSMGDGRAPGRACVDPSTGDIFYAAGNIVLVLNSTGAKLREIPFNVDASTGGVESMRFLSCDFVRGEFYLHSSAHVLRIDSTGATLNLLSARSAAYYGCTIG